MVISVEDFLLAGEIAGKIFFLTEGICGTLSTYSQ